MQLRIFENIEDLTPQDWDSHHNGSFYFRHSFLKLLREADVEKASYRYLCFSSQGQPAGLAVLSKFNLNLDLLSGEPLLVRMIKRVKPGFFKIPVIFAGTPGSFGQAPFFLFDSQNSGKAQQLIHQAVDNWGDEENIPLRIWMELPVTEFSDKFKGLQYLEFPSLPDMHLPLNWGSVENFILQMRSNYCRKVKSNFQDWKQQRGFSLQPFCANHVPEFYSGYEAVMQRTDTKLEVYSREFFEQLVTSDLEVEILSVTEAGQKISALLVEETQVLNFILVSKPHGHYPNALYNKLLHGAAFAGIERGKKLLRFGQTSMYSKAAIGCKPVPLRIYIRHKKASVQFLLAHFGKYLFPEATQKPLQVFKKSSPAVAKVPVFKIPA